MLSDKTAVHAPMPDGWYGQTRCGLNSYTGGYHEKDSSGPPVQIDPERVNCPECQSGMLYDLTEQVKNLNKMIEKLLMRLGGERPHDPDW